MWKKVKDKEQKAKQQGQVKCHSQSSAEIIMKTFSSHFLYFHCIFPHEEMRCCWVSLKRERAALAHCCGKVPFSINTINTALRWPGLFVPLRSKPYIHTWPKQLCRTPGAVEPCAAPGEHSQESNSSNWWFPHGWQPRCWLSSHRERISSPRACFPAQLRSLVQ